MSHSWRIWFLFINLWFPGSPHGEKLLFLYLAWWARNVLQFFEGSYKDSRIPWPVILFMKAYLHSKPRHLHSCHYLWPWAEVFFTHLCQHLFMGDKKIKPWRHFFPFWLNPHNWSIPSGFSLSNEMTPVSVLLTLLCTSPLEKWDVEASLPEF